MNCAQLMIKCLEAEKVQFIFGIPGEENLDVMDAMLDSNLRFVLVRHEQGAAFMADVYGRLTGRAGVCLSTLGPGATNLVTGVADANMDRAPVVALTGQASLDRMHKESHQYMDVVGMFHPITKWNTMLRHPAAIAESVRKAFKFSEEESPGATHLDFPEDLAHTAAPMTEVPLVPEKPPEPPKATDASIKAAAALINGAKNPMILAGNGVIRGHASDALRAFVKHTNLHVAETFMGKGCVPYKDKHSLLTIGLQAHDFVSSAFDVADVVITVGVDMVEYHPYLWNPTRKTKVVHIARTASEVDKHYPVKQEVIGDISSSLERLAEMLTPRDDVARMDAIRENILTEISRHEDDSGFPIKPQKILSDVRKVLGPSDILISDVGAHKMWIARQYPCLEPNTNIISNGFASMGIAVPGVMAAKLVYPDRKCLAISGDAGFMMNVQEIETAVRENIPIVVMIWRDGEYGLIKWKQMNKYGRPSHVTFTNPNFVKLAEAFGAVGIGVESAKDLKPALEKAFSLNKPVVIDCPVDYSENIKLTAELREYTEQAKNTMMISRHATELRKKQ
ncbi:MAG: acetolactate synthase large subunit [Planctomycetaceae bacterium]|nr:acetolactate synthase large subunit [Planctomycetaceae bacterium]